MVNALYRGFGDSLPGHAATYTHISTYAHHDKLIVISASTYYAAAPINSLYYQCNTFVGVRTITRPKSPRPRVGGVLGESSNPLPTSKGAGERCELLKRGSGQKPDRPNVFHYFQHPGRPLLTQ